MTKKRILFASVGAIILSLVALANLKYFPVWYRSPAVSGTIVDAKTGQPLAGVSVAVRWSVMRSTANMHDPEDRDLENLKTVTDANGNFKVPAWGPMKQGWGWFYFSTDPEISLSLPGHKDDFFSNRNDPDFDEITPWPFAVKSFEKPSWNEQKIPF